MPEKEQTYWFIFHNETVLLLISPDRDPLSLGDYIQQLQPYFTRQLKLEMWAQETFCAELTEDVSLPPELMWVPLRKAFETIPLDWYKIVVAAYSVINWDKNHQYCGRCSNPTLKRLNVFERYCTACGLSVYPRISPSVIVLIRRGDEILMARSPHFRPGVFGLIAGFVEVGENLEEAVHREVKEEVGLTIKNLEYFASQPWPFPDSLMVGFLADYESGELIIDTTEIEAANWYRYDDLPVKKPTILSLARKLIDHHIAEMTKRQSKK